MMPVEQNHYEFLGVEPEASPEEIARAVAKLREMWAPGSLALYSLVDREEHKALLDRLEEAAVVLGDERARAAYDERHGIGRKAPPPPPKPRPGPAKQLALPEIVEAVDGAPAWPTTSAAPAAAPVAPDAGMAPVVESGPVAAAEAEPEEAAPAAAAESGARVRSAVATPATPEAAPGEVRVAASAGPAPEAEPASLATAPKAPAANAVEDDGIDIDLDDFDEPAGDGISPAGPRALAAALDRLSAPAAKAPAPRDPAPAPLPPMPELGPDTEYTGELLRRIREARGVGLRELANRTRITLGHLENLEAEAYANLPERVYLRGILTAYARELKLDGARLAETYLARWAARRR